MLPWSGPVRLVSTFVVQFQQLVSSEDSSQRSVFTQIPKTVDVISFDVTWIGVVEVSNDIALYS